MTTAGSMTLSATATYLLPDANPADNTGSLTVNQTPAGPPPVSPPPKPRVYCVVPNLHGLTVAKARIRAAKAHCTLVTVNVHLASSAIGRIRGQSPKPGTKLKARALVHIVVSLGPKKTKRHGASHRP